MCEMESEPWIKEKYNEIPLDQRRNFALVSMKIKRFRVISRIIGREAVEELVKQVYQTTCDWLLPGELIARASVGCFNLIMHLPREMSNSEVLIRMTNLTCAIRDNSARHYSEGIYCGFGIYMLTDEPVDFYVAQYNADICRSECPERGFLDAHMEIYDRTFKDEKLKPTYSRLALEVAMERGDIRMYLQPKVSLETGKIESAEALVRWIDPALGMIPLAEFLPHLEENGAIEDIDYFIFDQACAHIDKWTKEYAKEIQISVNLSKPNFNYWMSIEKFCAIFEKYSCPKSCIELELLESLVLNQVEHVNKVVREIHDYGFSCSLDDFGSGYSSFSVLTNSDLDTMKIDRSLFQNFENPKEQALLYHIINSAHELKMKVVAEGVEDPRYISFLKNLNCEFIQGFVFYKPMSADEFEERFVRGTERVNLS